MEGTSLLRFRRAFVDVLKTRVENVSYDSPMQPADMMGEDGSGVACWWADDAELAGEVNVIVGGDQIWFDETVVTKLRIQGLGLDTDDTQDVVDQRAVEVLGEVIHILCLPATLDIDDDEIQMFTALYQGATYAGGKLGTNNRAAQIEVLIELTARLKLGSLP